MRFRSLIMVALVGWLGLACATHGSISYRFDRSVSAEDQRIIKSAATPWNDITLDDTKLVYDPDGEYVIYTPERVAADGVDTIHGRECTYKGKDCPRAHAIYIRRDLDPDRKSRVATHEFGHALQLKHTTEDPKSSDPPAIMHPWVTSDRPTELDTAECQKAGACAAVFGHPKSN